MLLLQAGATTHIHWAIISEIPVVLFATVDSVFPLVS